LYPEKTAELHAEIKHWRETLQAPVPSEPNPEYQAEVAKKALLEARE